MNKIFGVGAHRTATLSLHVALKSLGFKSAHWLQHEEVTEGVKKNCFKFKLLEHYDALLDYPTPVIFKKLDKNYPNSKFILTIRETRSWIRSVENFIGDRDLIFEEWLFYKIKKFNKKTFVKKYQDHNNRIKRYFKNRPKDLLVINIVKGEGWNKLCPFLNKGIPNRPFPHIHKGIYKTK